MGLCVLSLPISHMIIVILHYVITLSSAYRKYDPFAIVWGYVMKQWYVLYVFYILMICYWYRYMLNIYHDTFLLVNSFCLNLTYEFRVLSQETAHTKYSISQEICTWFCCALLCCGYAIVHNEFTWSIYPYSSGLLAGTGAIVRLPQCQWS